jgi:hypothetical protein
MEDFIDVKVGDRIEEKNITLGSPEQNNQRVIVTRSKVFFKVGILWLCVFNICYFLDKQLGCIKTIALLFLWTKQCKKKWKTKTQCSSCQKAIPCW